jgi:hypothetical protein
VRRRYGKVVPSGLRKGLLEACIVTAARAAHATARAAGAGLHRLAITSRTRSGRNSSGSGSNRRPSSTTRPEAGLHAGWDALKGP